MELKPKSSQVRTGFIVNVGHYWFSTLNLSAVANY